jgi:hypothetical protein
VSSTSDKGIAQQGVENTNATQTNIEQANGRAAEVKTISQTPSNADSETRAKEKPQCLTGISDTGGKLPRVIAEGRTCLREQLPIEVLSVIEKSQKRKYVEYLLSVAMQPSNPDDDRNPHFQRYYAFIGSKDETGRNYDYRNAGEIESGWVFTKSGKLWTYVGREE